MTLTEADLAELGAREKEIRGVLADEGMTGPEWDPGTTRLLAEVRALWAAVRDLPHTDIQHAGAGDLMLVYEGEDGHGAATSGDPTEYCPACVVEARLAKEAPPA